VQVRVGALVPFVFQIPAAIYLHPLRLDPPRDIRAYAVAP